MVLIAVENFLAGTDVTISSSSEDTLYVLENLYNGRPSKPFRFTGVGAPGAPEWICAEFDAPKKVTLAGIFNHNLTEMVTAGDELRLKGCDDPCGGSGGCAWNAPDVEYDIQPRLVPDWNDLYYLLNETRLSYRFDFIDQANMYDVEVGELWLAEYTELSTAYLKPGRKEDPKFYNWRNVTPYGQHWVEAQSYSIKLDLVVTNLSDPHVVDSVRLVIQAIHDANGRFVIVPNDEYNFGYYVMLENDEGFMSQVSRGLDCEATEWTFELMTLTKGIALL